MKTESLQCNNCGAEIEVSSSTRFATCGHCGSKLAVVRTASAAYTELADKVSELSDRVQTHLVRTEQRNALAQLDREWEMDRENYMIATKHGGKHIPTRSESAIAGTVITIFGVFWTIMALGITGMGAAMMGGPGGPPGVFALIPCVFPAFGVLFIVLGIYQSMSAYDKATRYESAKARYEARRRQLQSEREDS